MAIKGLALKGEVITTPFSFVATTSSIVWEGCQPVFVDIDAKSLNIDPQKIEAAITPKTFAILATHVYGNPCDVEAIQVIADKYKLKVIYDATHCFGVKLNGASVFEYGDISICSLHATKLFHTVEGGLICAKNPKTLAKLKSMRNFGFAGTEAFDELGINGKNSEFHAVMGLTNLKYIDEIHKTRKKLTEAYHRALGDTLTFSQWHQEATKNYAYMPVLFLTEEQLLKTVEQLQKENIQTRRYFYPSLAAVLPYLPVQHLPVTENRAKRVLCLPLYYDLTGEEVEKICGIIKDVVG